MTNPVTVVVVPVPLMVVPRGVHVMVQGEVEGKPFRITLPVATVQVGCVMIPTVGAGGAVDVCGLITTFADAKEVHPEALVTV